jgi:hypothetical protein
MHAAHSEPARNNPNDEIRLGVASWDDGSNTEKSVKYTWFDRNGKVARGGEVPVAALPQMLEFAIRHGYLLLSPYSVVRQGGEMSGPMKFTAAFAAFGAKLKNKMWAFSAIADDGALVLSCWDNFLRSFVDGHKRYEDRLSRWGKSGLQGKALLTEHLTQAFRDNLPVRLVVAKLDDPRDLPLTEGNAGPLRKKFFIDRTLTGRIVSFDGDSFAIEYR